MAKVEVSDNLKEQLIDLDNLVAKLEEIKTAVNTLRFLSTEELSNLTGWSKATWQGIFNLPDFPSTNFGKEGKVEVEALRKYFSVPRRTEDYPNWNRKH